MLNFGAFQYPQLSSEITEMLKPTRPDRVSVKFKQLTQEDESPESQGTPTNRWVK